MRINVLGPIEISGGGDGRLAGPGQRALLAALALALYQSGYQAMRQELGIEPGAWLRSVYQRILAGDPDPSVPASPGGENWPAGVPFR